MRKPMLLIALGLSTALAMPAQAHKMKVFASAEGSTIIGHAYFSSGSRSQDSEVTVTAADGSPLASMKTDAEGGFRFEAKRRIDHIITVDGRDGHSALYTVPAAELPDSLPGGAPEAAMVMAPAPVGTAAPNDPDLRRFIDQSVSRQIRPLREQIDAYQEKIWWHDVMGGLGTILGLGGLAFGLAERRRRLDKDAAR